MSSLSERGCLLRECLFWILEPRCKSADIDGLDPHHHHDRITEHDISNMNVCVNSMLEYILYLELHAHDTTANNE